MSPEDCCEARNLFALAAKAPCARERLSPCLDKDRYRHRQSNDGGNGVAVKTRTFQRGASQMRGSPVELLTQSETSMLGVVNAAKNDELTDEELAALARRLAYSGSSLPIDKGSADVASTGGIGSLSTLLCPLQLAEFGLKVPKIGVPGRPAGGVDVLQCIPGFNALLSPSAALEQLNRVGSFHVLAGESWTPLDAALFDYRQRVGAQALPALVIASLLAKKVAAGVFSAGLDVRVADGANFGGDFDSARQNARRYVRVAKLLGLSGICVLTDCSQPYQPYVGRGEALLGLWLALNDEHDGWLSEHVELCATIATAVAGRPPARVRGRGRKRDSFAALLDAQGSSWQEFERCAASVDEAPRSLIRATNSGYVVFGTQSMRKILVERQQREKHHAPRPSDPAGIIVLAMPGEYVEVGQPLMALRHPPGEAFLLQSVTACVEVTATINEVRKNVQPWRRYEVIDA